MSIHYLNGMLTLGEVVTMPSIINIAVSRGLAHMKQPALATWMENIGMVMFIAGLLCMGLWIVLAQIFGPGDAAASSRALFKTLVSGFSPFP